MANRTEMNSLPTAASRSLPLVWMVYGPKPVFSDEDGFQPGGDDFSDQLFPLRDSFGEMLSLRGNFKNSNVDGRREDYLPRAGQLPDSGPKPVQAVVGGPHHAIVYSGGFRLRE